MERYVLRFKKTENPDIHSSKLDKLEMGGNHYLISEKGEVFSDDLKELNIDGNHYLISGGEKIISKNAKVKACEYFTEFIKDKKFPKEGILETTIVHD